MDYDEFIFPKIIEPKKYTLDGYFIEVERLLNLINIIHF